MKTSSLKLKLLRAVMYLTTGVTLGIIGLITYIHFSSDGMPHAEPERTVASPSPLEDYLWELQPFLITVPYKMQNHSAQIRFDLKVELNDGKQLDKAKKNEAKIRDSIISAFLRLKAEKLMSYSSAKYAKLAIANAIQNVLEVEVNENRVLLENWIVQ